MIDQFNANDPENPTNVPNIALMYRSDLGLQHANDVKEWLDGSNLYFGKVYFSSGNSEANYELDIPIVFGKARYIIVIVTKNFTKDFPQTIQAYETDYKITAKEVGQVMRRYAEFLENREGVTRPSLVLMHYDTFSRTDIDNLKLIASFERPNNPTIQRKMVELFTCASINRVYGDSQIDDFTKILGFLHTERVNPPSNIQSQTPCPYRISSSFFLNQKKFVGREDIFPLIENAISEYKRVFLYGISGIGKTWIAKEFARRMKDKASPRQYIPIVFLEYNPKDGLQRLFENELEIKLQGTSPDHLVNEDACEKIKIVSQYFDEILIIIDNFNILADKDEFFSYLNEKGDFHIIFTTQNKQADYTMIEISELNDDDLKQLFLNIQDVSRRRQIENDQDFPELFSILGRHTFAITLAANYYSRKVTFTRIRQLIDALQKEGVESMTRQGFNTDNVENFLHLVQLTDLTSAERELLEIIYAHESSRVSIEETESDTGQIAPWRSKHKNEQTLDEALDNLINKFYVLYDGSYFVIHDIIQTVLRYEKQKEDEDKSIKVNTSESMERNDLEDESNTDEINVYEKQKEDKDKSIEVNTSESMERNDLEDESNTDEINVVEDPVQAPEDPTIKAITLALPVTDTSQEDSAEKSRVGTIVAFDKKVSGSDVTMEPPADKELDPELSKLAGDIKSEIMSQQTGIIEHSQGTIQFSYDDKRGFDSSVDKDVNERAPKPSPSENMPSEKILRGIQLPPSSDAKDRVDRFDRPKERKSTNKLIKITRDPPKDISVDNPPDRKLSEDIRPTESRHPRSATDERGQAPRNAAVIVHRKSLKIDKQTKGDNANADRPLPSSRRRPAQDRPRDPEREHRKGGRDRRQRR